MRNRNDKPTELQKVADRKAPSKMNTSRNCNGKNVVDNFFKRQIFRKFCIVIVIIIVTLGILAIGAGIYAFFQFENRKAEMRLEEIYLKDLISKVNGSPNARWKAKFNPFGMRKRSYDQKTLRNVTAVKEYFDKIEKFFKSDVMEEHLRELSVFSTENLPHQFDARLKWPLCHSLHRVPNQGGCGSCFAVSAMGVASDRSCIQSNGTLKSELSAENVLGCCQACGNCYGGDPLKALTYWAIEGVVTGGADGCLQYLTKAECGTPCLPSTYSYAEKLRKCHKKCQVSYYKNDYDNDKHSGSIAYTLYPRKMTLDQAGNNRVMVSSVIGHFNSTSKVPLGVKETRDIIRKELLLYGPTTFAFPVTEEFLHYESGVFHPFPQENFEERIIYWHVVRLIGWGHDEENRFFWIAINSFGTEWGENGFFRIDPTLLEKFGLEYEAGLL